MRLARSQNPQNGYIALISVLIMGGVMLVAGLSVSRAGIESAKGAVSSESSLRAHLLADACAEEALLRLRANLLYAGSETVSVNVSEYCTIGSIGGVGATNRLIRATGEINGYVQKIELSVATITPMLRVTTWRSVADFSL